MFSLTKTFRDGSQSDTARDSSASHSRSAFRWRSNASNGGGAGHALSAPVASTTSCPKVNDSGTAIASLSHPSSTRSMKLGLKLPSLRRHRYSSKSKADKGNLPAHLDTNEDATPVNSFSDSVTSLSRQVLTPASHTSSERSAAHIISCSPAKIFSRLESSRSNATVSTDASGLTASADECLSSRSPNALCSNSDGICGDGLNNDISMSSASGERAKPCFRRQLHQEERNSALSSTENCSGRTTAATRLQTQQNDASDSYLGRGMSFELETRCATFTRDEASNARVSRRRGSNLASCGHTGGPVQRADSYASSIDCDMGDSALSRDPNSLCYPNRGSELKVRRLLDASHFEDGSAYSDASNYHNDEEIATIAESLRQHHLRSAC